jgi:prepilin-type N-terminal cleavage/methylation domain-containing protein
LENSSASTFTMSRFQSNSQAGFTLMESLIASIILGLALGSILAISSHSYRYLSDIRLMARSSQVLQQKMEDLRLLSWSDLQAAPTNFTDSVHPGIFQGTLSRAAYDWSGGVPTAARVTLTVTWTNRNQQVSTNSLTTIMANGGLNKYIF